MWPDDLLRQVEDLVTEYHQEETEYAAFGLIPHFGFLLGQLQHLQQHVLLGACDLDTLAIGAAFALVRLASAWELPDVPPSPHPWPPPRGLVEAAQHEWGQPALHRDDTTAAARRERALEFVVAFLLGWHRQPLYVE